MEVTCEEGENLCPPRPSYGVDVHTCSRSGVCYSGVNGGTPLEDARGGEEQARGELTLELLGAATVEVMQGKPYGPCEADAPLSRVCDRGARAFHTVQGDLTENVLVCSDGDKNWLFSDDGVRPCQVDTDTPGIYTVTFTVPLPALRLYDLMPSTSTDNKCWFDYDRAYGLNCYCDADSDTLGCR